MGEDVKNQTRFCQIPQLSKKGSNWHLKSRIIFMAVGLSFILTTSLMYYLMLPKSLPLPPLPIVTEHDAIAIDGDADFAATALLEGWPGDGSSENPYIIDGLNIDIDDNDMYCISITNTQVSFIISNCSFTGAITHFIERSPTWHWGVGIFLENVINCKLVKNIIDSDAYGIAAVNLNSSTITDNICYGSSHDRSIKLENSTYNTIANNTCNDNQYQGIELFNSRRNIVVNNTCNGNIEDGIYLHRSDANTITDNTCNSNELGGITLLLSDANIVENNTCNYNEGEAGIRLEFSNYNAVSDNTCNNNEWGINLHESKGNELFNNTCNNNTRGIYLNDSGSAPWAISDWECIVANNICNGNTEDGIHIQSSFIVIVYDNICTSNEWGIYLGHSNDITLFNNTCNYDRIGIYLHRSDVKTITDNTCNYNRIGIFLYCSEIETIASNTCNGNTEHDIIEESETGILPI
ncbi:MAG: NosD domain-containing protein, partial [Promethearchaeota archaeon]